MKIRNIVLLTVLLTILAAGCNKNEPPHDYSKPIAAVMQSRREAYTNATTTVANHGNTIYTVSLPTFAGEMRKLDLSACPSDFREAWQSYIDTVEKRQTKDPILRYTAQGAKFSFSGKWDVPLDHNWMEFNGAWEQLNDTAEKYQPPQP